MRRWQLSLMLAVVAVGLAAALLRPAHNRILTHNDGTVVADIDGPAVVVFRFSVADVVCLRGNPCPLRAAATVDGLYPRPGVPFSVAFLAGRTLPALLLLVALAVAARRRWVTIACLLGAAALLAL